MAPCDDAGVLTTGNEWLTCHGIRQEEHAELPTRETMPCEAREALRPPEILINPSALCKRKQNRPDTSYLECDRRLVAANVHVVSASQLFTLYAISSARITN